jgi:hypothetical protein
VEQQTSIEHSDAADVTCPLAAAAPPADAPREVNGLVSRRAWTEPRARLFWLLALGVLLVTLYLLVIHIASWSGEHRLFKNGTQLSAVVIRAQSDIHDITLPDKTMPPDTLCTIRFDWDGKPYEPAADYLAEHMERGEHIITGPNHPVKIRVDPNDPEKWTDRTEPPPFFSRKLIGVVIGTPIVLLLLVAALVKHRGVLDVWRNGRATQALVLGTGQTPVAPRSRAARCTAIGGSGADNDKRVFTVYLPARAGRVENGDVLWVVRPANKPEPAYAAAWFERT